MTSKKIENKNFSDEELLFRSPVKIDKSDLGDFYKDKVVLVTGGGGSIGSELVRQLATLKLKKLVIFDIYENNAYLIQQEIVRKYGKSVDLAVEIGSVRDEERLEQIFSFYKPDIVFHTAAHKHVPMMETSGCEAIKNNCFGTFYTANMAEKYNCEKFVLISTDKAVNPTNIMGASKRVCEMIVQCRKDSKTQFCAVRFGNVLNSNGSVVPLFKKQIEEGGPVTITDKRIIRYFMTINEASTFLLKTAIMAKNGNLFVLDMGSPVKIYDLAVNMINLMGKKVDEDIKIEEIGLRPGEKLYEELLTSSETLQKTNNSMIYIQPDKIYSREEVKEKLEVLKSAVKNSFAGDSSKIKEALKQVLPTWQE